MSSVTKSVYAIQPYLVGSKHGKSLAVVIPVRVVKRLNLDTSTVPTLEINENTKTITLQSFNRPMAQESQ